MTDFVDAEDVQQIIDELDEIIASIKKEEKFKEGYTAILPGSSMPTNFLIKPKSTFPKKSSSLWNL